MSVFYLDDNNNFVVTNGHFTFKEDNEETRLLLLHKLKLWYGEWYLARSKGIRYKEKILVKGPDANIVKSEFKRAILGTKGVVSIKSFDLQQDSQTRELFVSATIITESGIITLNQEVV